MTAPHVEPAKLREEVPEVLLDDLQRLLQILRRPLTERVEVEALDTLGELRQFRSRHPEAGAWSTGVI